MDVIGGIPQDLMIKLDCNSEGKKDDMNSEIIVHTYNCLFFFLPNSGKFDHEILQGHVAFFPLSSRIFWIFLRQTYPEDSGGGVMWCIYTWKTVVHVNHQGFPYRNQVQVLHLLGVRMADKSQILQENSTIY